MALDNMSGKQNFQSCFFSILFRKRKEKSRQTLGEEQQAIIVSSPLFEMSASDKWWGGWVLEQATKENFLNFFFFGFILSFGKWWHAGWTSNNIYRERVWQ